MVDEVWCHLLVQLELRGVVRLDRLCVARPVAAATTFWPWPGGDTFRRIAAHSIEIVLQHCKRRLKDN
jgi:hypothetical protein